MLGATIDYWLLRPFVHAQNRATEEELDRDGSTSLRGDQETRKLPRILERFEGRFPLSPSLRYLDIGCGSGELTLALAKRIRETHGRLPSITGVDFLPRFVERARANAKAAGLEEQVRFECADIHEWQAPHEFDVAISFDALEHIANPRAFLASMGRYLGPGGVAVISFGPLFHSPFGDHMGEFFRVPIPWRGVLFSEHAILRLRSEFYRPTDPARRLTDIAGGLNLMRYSEFLRDARETGWRLRYLRTNTFLRNPLARRIAASLAERPRIGDYFMHNVYAVMEPLRDTSQAASGTLKQSGSETTRQIDTSSVLHAPAASASPAAHDASTLGNVFTAPDR